MNKISKIFIISIIILLFVNISNKVRAVEIQSEMDEIKLATTSINPDDYDPSKNPLTTTDAEKVTKKVGVVLGAIRNFSAVVSVIALMIIGLKYMLGSVEEKANYKATMMPYIIGCVMAVAGTTLVSFIYDAVN